VKYDLFLILWLWLVVFFIAGCATPQADLICITKLELLEGGFVRTDCGTEASWRKWGEEQTKQEPKKMSGQAL
jgi:hypothetical protein